MACFADINVSHGSVATYARCGGIFDIHLTASLPRNLPVKTFLNRLRIDRIMVMSLGLVFWPTLYFVRVSFFRSLLLCCFDDNRLFLKLIDALHAVLTFI